MRPVVLHALLALTLSPIVADAQRRAAVRQLPADVVRVVPRYSRAAGTGLTVHAGGRRYLVPLAGRLGTWQIDSAGTLGVATRADTFYLLADVSGRARANDGGGQCGAGTNGDIVWMKLARGRVAAVQTAPYRECFRSLNAENDEPYTVNADSLHFQGMQLRGNREVRIHYAFRQAPRGLDALVDTARADSLPRYPRQLALANIEGEVVVRVPYPRRRAPDYALDTLPVVRSSHPLFTKAVRDVMSDWTTHAWNDSLSAPKVLRFVFALRSDAECRGLPPAGWMRRRGARAGMERGVARVEVCGETVKR